MNTTVNKANIATLVSALTTIAMIVDKRMGWNMGIEFYGAVGMILTWTATYWVPNKAIA